MDSSYATPSCCKCYCVIQDNKHNRILSVSDLWKLPMQMTLCTTLTPKQKVHEGFSHRSVRPLLMSRCLSKQILCIIICRQHLFETIIHQTTNDSLSICMCVCRCVNHDSVYSIKSDEHEVMN